MNPKIFSTIHKMGGEIREIMVTKEGKKLNGKGSCILVEFY